MMTIDIGKGKAALSLGLRIAGLGFVFLILFVALIQVDGLVNERNNLRQSAVSRTAHEWGGVQEISMVVLRLPCKKNGQDISTWIVPDSLQVDLQMRSDTRTRGIYDVPLYHAEANLNGTLRIPADAAWLSKLEKPDWKNAQFGVVLAEVRSLEINPELSWNDQSLALESGGKIADEQNIIWASLPELKMNTDYAFQLRLQFRGASALRVYPAGSDTTITIKSDWPSPAFAGAYLPLTHQITDQGFTAQWRIPRMGRSTANVVLNADEPAIASRAELAEVEFSTPVDTWRLSQRTVKYGLLFLLVPFIVFFLLELFGRRKIHYVQYILAASALVVFFVVLIGLGEHLGFALAYLISATAISALLAWFAASIHQSAKAGLAWLAGLLVLYGLLYIIINLEETALLIGSIFLLVMLAGLMFAARRVNWQALTKA